MASHRGQLRFTSSLPSARHQELVDLLFFNVNQHRFRNDIVNSIDVYGVPEIIQRNDRLSVAVGDLGPVQALYALWDEAESSEIAGVAIYARVAAQKIVLLHIGVGEAYSASGGKADGMIALRLIQQVRRVARVIQGVSELEILYGSRPMTIRVR